MALKDLSKEDLRKPTQGTVDLSRQQDRPQLMEGGPMPSADNRGPNRERQLMEGGPMPSVDTKRKEPQLMEGGPMPSVDSAGPKVQEGIGTPLANKFPNLNKKDLIKETGTIDPSRMMDRPQLSAGPTAAKLPTKQQLMQSDQVIAPPKDQPTTIHTPIDESSKPWWERYNEAADPSSSNDSGTSGTSDRDPSKDPIVGYMGSQITDPTLAEAAKQTYTPLTMGEGEEQTIRQMQERGPIEGPGSITGDTEASKMEGSTIQPFQEATAAEVAVAELAAAREAEIAATGSVSPATAAKYEAALAARSASTKAANGSVTRLVDAVQGELSDEAMAKAAIQELDKVDPRSLVDAKTHEVPNGATVKGQLDQLLGDLEEGNVPAWAQPAVAQTEAMLASRGLSTSSVGRQALFNSIISSAMPIAQQDAKAKLSVFQQDISNEQQATLANAQFFQTLTAQNLSNQQQTALANAATVAKMDMANADRAQQAQIENARNFLQMDLANLSSQQQANLLDSQNRQQTLLSNQAAENSARQFNAASEQQANQFNANLAAEMSKFNAQQANSMSQFNAAQVNQQAAQQAQLEQQANIQQAQLETGVSQQTATLSAQQAQAQAQLDQQANLANMQAAADNAKFDAQMQAQISQFNAQMDFNRDQFNVQNATAIEQSNVQWRRQMNQLNTAGENAVNQANAMNAFNLSNQALTFMWQENRDRAKWAFEGGQNEEERKTRMAIAALGNEALKDAKTVSNITNLAAAAARLFDNWGD